MGFQMILNGVVTGGMKLAIKVIGAMGIGVVLTSSLTGFAVADYTPWQSQLICAIGILAWGILVGHVVRTNIDRQKVIKLQLKDQSIELEKLNRLLTETVLARFLPPKLVREIVTGQHSFEESPKRYSATILFSDLVGFTALTSDLRASRMARVLNEYLIRMTDVIYSHGGSIAQFSGDGILVIFGVPEDMTATRQAEQSCACALAMHDALDDLNREWTGTGIPEIRMRIGLHHGPVVAGMFGGNKRSDYTAIGSTVNMAARIQAVCHEGQSFISGELFDCLQEGAARPAGRFQLKGVGETALYQLVKPDA